MRAVLSFDSNKFVPAEISLVPSDIATLLVR